MAFEIFVLVAIPSLLTAVGWLIVREQMLTRRLNDAFLRIGEMETRNSARSVERIVHANLESHAERLYRLELANGRIAAALTSEAK